MARVMILDVDGNERDFSARQTVYDLRYNRLDRDGGYRISDHIQSYRVSAKEYERASKAELDALMKGTTFEAQYEGEIESGRTGGVEVGELPGCSAQNFQRVLGGAARASAKLFGHEDDFFGTRR